MTSSVKPVPFVLMNSRTDSKSPFSEQMGWQTTLNKYSRKFNEYHKGAFSCHLCQDDQALSSYDWYKCVKVLVNLFYLLFIFYHRIIKSHALKESDLDKRKKFWLHLDKHGWGIHDEHNLMCLGHLHHGRDGQGVSIK